MGGYSDRRMGVLRGVIILLCSMRLDVGYCGPRDDSRFKVLDRVLKTFAK